MDDYDRYSGNTETSIIQLDAEDLLKRSSDPYQGTNRITAVKVVRRTDNSNKKRYA